MITWRDVKCALEELGVTEVLFIGCNLRKCTFRHLAEYQFTERKVQHTACGDSELKLVSSKAFVKLAHELMEKRGLKAFYADNGGWDPLRWIGRPR